MVSSHTWQSSAALLLGSSDPTLSLFELVLEWGPTEQVEKQPRSDGVLLCSLVPCRGALTVSFNATMGFVHWERLG